MISSKYQPAVTNFKKIGVLVASTIAFLTANSANAESASAFAKATFRISLTDLAPDDGIAPSFIPGTPSSVSRSAVGGFLNKAGYLFSDRGTGFGAFGGSGTSGLDFASASVSGQVTDGGEITMASNVFVTDQDANADSIYAFSSFGNHGILSPHTSVTFYVDYELNAASDWQTGQKTVSILSGRFSNSGGSSSGDIYLKTDSMKAGSFAFTLTNSYDRGLSSYASFNAYTAAVAVPEPATYGMVLAGLGLVAMAARRRKLI